MRRRWYQLVAVLLWGAAAVAQAQGYPAKPVKFIVPYPPGGIADTFSRALADQLAERLAQPVIPENKPGGSLIVGTSAAAQAPADGYTLLLGSISSLAINVGAFKKLPYDPVKDFAPMSLAFYTPLLLVTSRRCRRRRCGSSSPREGEAGHDYLRLPRLRQLAAPRRARCSRPWPASTSCTCRTRAPPPRCPTSSAAACT